MNPDSTAGHVSLTEDVLKMLRSPKSRQALHFDGTGLVSADGSERFEVSASGIPLFAREFLSAAGRAQQEHYDRIAAKYVENLEYPHTEEYMAYLDRQFVDILPAGSLGTVAELCCGRGEAARLLKDRIDRYVGADVSVGLLDNARRDLPEQKFFFVQSDATLLPLDDALFDNVVMLGGIHHVPDRARLFAEIKRILKPGGGFYFREPVDDFLLWRGIRKVVYRASDFLDHNLEHPLRRQQTEDALHGAGLKLTTWRTYGFLGFCLFMNSDVLVFNRLFRYLPAIRRLTRAACRLDDWTTNLPGLRHAGLQVIGAAEARLGDQGK
jgi:ubiquinone/menaquinone biosynthesis C-methylase UbiE